MAASYRQEAPDERYLVSIPVLAASCCHHVSAMLLWVSRSMGSVGNGSVRIACLLHILRDRQDDGFLAGCGRSPRHYRISGAPEEHRECSLVRTSCPLVEQVCSDPSKKLRTCPGGRRLASWANDEYKWRRWTSRTRMNPRKQLRPRQTRACRSRKGEDLCLGCPSESPRCHGVGCI